MSAREAAPSSAPSDKAGHERGPPQEPVPPREPQDADHATADPVEQHGDDAGRPGNRVVRAAHLAETTIEGFRDERERRDLDEHIAGDGHPQPEARVAQVPRGAFVDEGVIDAAGRARLVGRLEQPIRAEVDAPVVVRGALRQRLRRRAIEREAGAIRRHERFGEAQREPQRRPVGTESDRLLRRLARREQAHFPSVRRVDVTIDERGECGLAASFELDVVLHGFVVRELRSDAQRAREQRLPFRERARLLDGFAARELDVEMEDRDRQREKLPRDRKRPHGRGEVRGPEHGLAGQRDGGHGT